MRKHDKSIFISLIASALLAAQIACAPAAAPKLQSAACKLGDSVAEYRNLSPAQQTQLVEKYRQQYSPALEKVRAALKAPHPDPPFRVLARLKVVDSIQEKISRRKYNCLSEMTDIAGSRIVIPSYAALPLVTENIERALKTVEKEDMITDQRGTGYRAIHYLADVDGRIVEIQIHTHRGTIWAEASHRLVYKGPFSQDKAVIAYLNRLSEAIFWLDSGLLRELPDVPQSLPAEAREDLKKVVVGVRDYGLQSAFELNQFYAQLAREILERDSFDLDDVVDMGGSSKMRKSIEQKSTPER
ncbi:MAG TPA: RelA/SpoT domain-containing protein [Candidatus Binatia bacterium]|jgi:ppGpp synthetase/RelA/SpoT-type nucleotidyltranferase